MTPLLEQFHENITFGNLLPVWTASADAGRGSPQLAFQAPLPLYAAELFRLAGAGDELSIRLAALCLAALGAAFAFLFFRAIVSKSRFATAAAAVAAAAYIGTPGLAAAACLASVAWTAYAARECWVSPGTRKTVHCATAIAALCLSHFGVALLSLGWLVAAAPLWRRRFPGWPSLAAAVFLGWAASSFYWVGLLAGQKHLAAIPAEPLPAFRLDELWLFCPLLAAGVLVTLWRWSTGLATKQALGWLAACAACACALHPRGSWLWWHVPDLHGVMTPVVFLPWLSLFAGALFIQRPSRLLLVLAAALAIARPWPGPAGLEHHEILPASARDSRASFRADVLGGNVVLLKGRADLSCTRRSPTLMECETLAVHPSVFRFNASEYPGWSPLQLSVPPGKHVLRWEMRATPLRLATIFASAAAWLFLLCLLFEDQLSKMKALFPKRVQYLEA